MADDHADYFAADAEDRRAALTDATQIAASGPRGVPWARGESFTENWLALADSAYKWLRNRDSLHPARLVITPGIPQSETPEGEAQ